MSKIEIFKIDESAEKAYIPRIGGLSAGFPSPATDYTGDRIDLNEELILHPGNTYFARIRDYYLLEEEMEPGDAILFDVSLRPRKGDLAVCMIDGEVQLKYIDSRQGRYVLVEGASSQQEVLDEESQAYVLGIVTWLIRLRREKGRRIQHAERAERQLKLSSKRAIRWGQLPADHPGDGDDRAVDLNRELISHRIYTAFGQAVGQSLREDAIDDGDSVIIDRILDPIEGDLVVSYQASEFMMKYIEVRPDGIWLVPGNSEYRAIRVCEEEDTDKLVWGIVTYSLKQLRFKEKAHVPRKRIA